MLTRTKGLMAVAMVSAWAAICMGQEYWTAGNGTQQWDDPLNWTGGTLPVGGIMDIPIDGYTAVPVPGAPTVFPLIDSSMDTDWGIVRLRGPGVPLDKDNPPSGCQL